MLDSQVKLPPGMLAPAKLALSTGPEEPSLGQGDVPMCGAESGRHAPGGGYNFRCTLDAGHAGAHVAHDFGDHVVHEWPNEREADESEPVESRPIESEPIESEPIESAPASEAAPALPDFHDPAYPKVISWHNDIAHTVPVHPQALNREHAQALANYEVHRRQHKKLEDELLENDEHGIPVGLPRDIQRIEKSERQLVYLRSLAEGAGHAAVGLINPYYKFARKKFYQAVRPGENREYRGQLLPDRDAAIESLYPAWNSVPGFPGYRETHGGELPPDMRVEEFPGIWSLLNHRGEIIHSGIHQHPYYAYFSDPAWRERVLADARNKNLVARRLSHQFGDPPEIDMSKLPIWTFGKTRKKSGEWFSNLPPGMVAPAQQQSDEEPLGLADPPILYGRPPEFQPEHIDYIRRRFAEGANVIQVAKELQTYPGAITTLINRHAETRGELLDPGRGGNASRLGEASPTVPRQGVKTCRAGKPIRKSGYQRDFMPRSRKPGGPEGPAGGMSNEPLELADSDDQWPDALALADIETIEQPEWENWSSGMFHNNVDLGTHFTGLPDRMSFYGIQDSPRNPSEEQLMQEQGLSRPVRFGFTRTDPRTGENSSELTGGGKLGLVMTHVVNALDRLLSKHRPLGVDFIAVEPKRQKAYRQLAQYGAQVGMGNGEYKFMERNIPGYFAAVHKSAVESPKYANYHALDEPEKAEVGSQEPNSAAIGAANEPLESSSAAHARRLGLLAETGATDMLPEEYLPGEQELIESMEDAIPGNHSLGYQYHDFDRDLPRYLLARRSREQNPDFEEYPTMEDVSRMRLDNEEQGEEQGLPPGMLSLDAGRLVDMAVEEGLAGPEEKAPRIPGHGSVEGYPIMLAQRKVNEIAGLEDESNPYGAHIASPHRAEFLNEAQRRRKQYGIEGHDLTSPEGRAHAVAHIARQLYHKAHREAALNRPSPAPRPKGNGPEYGTAMDNEEQGNEKRGLPPGMLALGAMGGSHGWGYGGPNGPGNTPEPAPAAQPAAPTAPTAPTPPSAPKPPTPTTPTPASPSAAKPAAPAAAKPPVSKPTVPQRELEYAKRAVRTGYETEHAGPSKLRRIADSLRAKGQRTSDPGAKAYHELHAQAHEAVADDIENAYEPHQREFLERARQPGQTFSLRDLGGHYKVVHNDIHPEGDLMDYTGPRSIGSVESRARRLKPHEAVFTEEDTPENRAEHMNLPREIIENRIKSLQDSIHSGNHPIKHQQLAYWKDIANAQKERFFDRLVEHLMTTAPSAPAQSRPPQSAPAQSKPAQSRSAPLAPEASGQRNAMGQHTYKPEAAGAAAGAPASPAAAPARPAAARKTPASQATLEAFRNMPDDKLATMIDSQMEKLRTLPREHHWQIQRNINFLQRIQAERMAQAVANQPAGRPRAPLPPGAFEPGHQPAPTPRPRPAAAPQAAAQQTPAAKLASAGQEDARKYQAVMAKYHAMSADQIDEAIQKEVEKLRTLPEEQHGQIQQNIAFLQRIQKDKRDDEWLAEKRSPLGRIKHFLGVPGFSNAPSSISPASLPPGMLAPGMLALSGEKQLAGKQPANKLASSPPVKSSPAESAREAPSRQAFASSTIRALGEGKEIHAPEIVQALVDDKPITAQAIRRFQKDAFEKGVSQEFIGKASKFFSDFNGIRQAGNYAILPEQVGATKQEESAPHDVVLREGVMNTPPVQGIRRRRLDKVYRGIRIGRRAVQVGQLVPEGADRLAIPKEIRGRVPRVFLNVPITQPELRVARPASLSYPMVVTGNPALTNFRRPHPSWDSLIKVVRVKPVYHGIPAAHAAAVAAINYANQIGARILVTPFRARNLWRLANLTDGIVPTDPAHPDFDKYWKPNSNPRPADPRLAIDWAPYVSRTPGHRDGPVEKAFRAAGWNTLRAQHGEGSAWWWPTSRVLDPKILAEIDPDTQLEFCDLLHKGCTGCRNCQKLPYPQSGGAPIYGITDEPFCEHGCPECFVRNGQNRTAETLGRRGISIKQNQKQQGFGDPDFGDQYRRTIDILHSVVRPADRQQLVDYVAEFARKPSREKMQIAASLYANGVITGPELRVMQWEIRAAESTSGGDQGHGLSNTTASATGGASPLHIHVVLKNAPPGVYLVI